MNHAFVIRDRCIEKLGEQLRGWSYPTEWAYPRCLFWSVQRQSSEGFNTIKFDNNLPALMILIFYFLFLLSRRDWIVCSVYRPVQGRYNIHLWSSMWRPGGGQGRNVMFFTSLNMLALCLLFLYFRRSGGLWPLQEHIAHSAKKMRSTWWGRRITCTSCGPSLLRTGSMLGKRCFLLR